MKTPTNRLPRRRLADRLRRQGIATTLHLAATLLLLGQPALADWPVARGDAAGTGVARTKIADSLDVLWQIDAKNDEASIEATAVIADGVVYVGDGAGVFRAIRLADGEPVWKKTFEDNWFTTAAAVGDGRVFVIDSEGVVRCLATKDGAPLWQFATESEAYAGPNLHRGSLLVTVESGFLISLDAKTGEEQWRFQIDGPLRCTPTVNKGHVLLAGCDAKLHAVDLTGGKASGAVDIGGQTGSTPALVGDRAYFGTEAGEFLAVDARDAKQPTVAWTYRDPRRGQGIRTAAAATNKAIVYASQGKAVYAINPKTGEPLWKRPIKSRVESSPVIVPAAGGGNRVFVATSRGRLMLLDLSDGEEVWDDETGGGFVASPAVEDGRIVIGNTDGTLYCLGKK